MLLCLSDSKPKQWSKFLPEALYAYRTNPKVAVRVRGATKGTAKWELGFLVLSGYQGGLRLKRLEDGRVFHYHQVDCRALPDPVPYEKVDPLTLKSTVPEDKADSVSECTGDVAATASITPLNPLADEFIPYVHMSGEAPSTLHGCANAIEVAPRGHERGQGGSEAEPAGDPVGNMTNGHTMSAHDWRMWLDTVHGL